MTNLTMYDKVEYICVTLCDVTIKIDCDIIQFEE